MIFFLIFSLGLEQRDMRHLSITQWMVGIASLFLFNFLNNWIALITKQSRKLQWSAFAVLGRK